MQYTLELLAKLMEIAELLARINKRSELRQPCYTLGEKVLYLSQDVINNHSPLSEILEKNLTDTILMAHEVMQLSQREKHE